MCAHWRGGDVTKKNLQGIPPTGGIHDAKERGKNENMIGDVTEKSVHIGGGEYKCLKYCQFNFGKLN